VIHYLLNLPLSKIAERAWIPSHHGNQFALPCGNSMAGIPSNSARREDVMSYTAKSKPRISWDGGYSAVQQGEDRRALYHSMAYRSYQKQSTLQIANFIVVPRYRCTKQSTTCRERNDTTVTERIPVENELQYEYISMIITCTVTFSFTSTYEHTAS